MEQVKQTTRQYINNIIRIYDNIQGHKPTYPKITTITSIFQSSKEIDLDKIKKKLKTPLIMHKKSGASIETFSWNIKPNGFYNQLTIEYSDYGYSKKSVKLFPNGRVHVTGCYDLKDCFLVSLQIRTLIRALLGDDSIDIINRRIVMINVNFSMNASLNLQEVINTMKLNDCSVSFNPEVYSAVKIKFKPSENAKQITASIFSSGCILITGAVNFEEISDSYAFLVSKLSDTKIDENMNSDDESFNFFMGHPFSQWRKLLVC